MLTSDECYLPGLFVLQESDALGSYMRVFTVFTTKSLGVLL